MSQPADPAPQFRKVEYGGLAGEAGEQARRRHEDEQRRSADWKSRGRSRMFIAAIVGAVVALLLGLAGGGPFWVHALATLWGAFAGGLIAAKRLGHLAATVLYAMPIIALRIPVVFGASDNSGLQVGYGRGMTQFCSWLLLLVFGALLSIWIEQRRSHTDLF